MQYFLFATVINQQYTNTHNFNVHYSIRARICGFVFHF